MICIRAILCESSAQMNRQLPRPVKSRRGFTLIELLIVIAIVGVLTVMVALNWGNLRLYAQRTTTINNMRQIGAAFYGYASDNDMRLPARTKTGEKWPRLLSAYLDDVKVYAAVGDRSNYIFQKQDPLDDFRNRTSYIMNGYNDLGALTNPAVEVRIIQMQRPSQTILLGTPKSGSTHYYMDMKEGRNGNHVDVLNLTLFGAGTDYLFADGSARFIKKEDYDPRMWLVDTNFVVP